jgi:protoheme IX farnesyltransferase
VTALQPRRHTADRATEAPSATFGDYMSLIKPRIIELLLVTTIPGHVPRRSAACRPPGLVLATLRGRDAVGRGQRQRPQLGASTATSTGSMRRTRRRPMPRVTWRDLPRRLRARDSASWIGIAARPSGLGLLVNWLSAAALSLLAPSRYYVVVYTILAQAAHRRRTSCGAGRPAACRC